MYHVISHQSEWINFQICDVTHCNMIHISEDLRASAVIVIIIKPEKDCPYFRNLEIAQ